MTLDRYPEYNVLPAGYVTSTRNTGKPTRVGSSIDYEVIQLVNDKGDRETISTHRLVAMCFLPNPNNLPQVNHIDGNKLNNCVTNLEWVSAKDNAKHAVEAELYRKQYPKFKSPFGLIKGNPVEQFVDSCWVRFMNSSEAGKSTGIDPSSIKSVCKGYRATAGGFVWRYSDIPNKPVGKNTIRAYRAIYKALNTEKVDVEHLINYIKGI